jgi:hypothetical protein
VVPVPLVEPPVLPAVEPVPAVLPAPLAEPAPEVLPAVLLPDILLPLAPAVPPPLLPSFSISGSVFEVESMELLLAAPSETPLPFGSALSSVLVPLQAPRESVVPNKASNTYFRFVFISK